MSKIIRVLSTNDISCESKKEPCTIIHSGLLEKRGHFRKNWLTRLFVLTPQSLCYYKRKSNKDRWMANPKYLRGEILLSDILKVDTFVFKDKKNCFYVRVQRKGGKKSPLDYLLQANSPEDVEKWIKHLRKSMKKVTTSNIGLETLELILHASQLPNTPAGDAAKLILRNFPVLAQLFRDMQAATLEKDLVYILDQIAGEVRHGAAGEYVKRTIMAAAETKLEQCPAIWTAPVKNVYGTIMRAVHTQPSLPKFHLEQGRSLSASCLEGSDSPMSIGSDAELDFVSKATTFNRVYEMGRVLGQGSYSIVRIARHRTTQKQYAVKCIPKKGLQDVDVMAMQSEVEIMRSLEHDNLVPLIDYFEEPNEFYIVTPLCTGGELFDELVKRECYTEEDARVVLRKLASAIDYLHSKGIAHRDLKPENILLKSSAPDAEIMIADFGFAKNLTSGLHEGTACGTPGYVAPEVVTGKPYGTAVDCWSLGVILYIMLCGYPPFAGENHAVILRRVVAADFNFNSPYWDTVSEEAKDLVRRLLTVNPCERLCTDGIMAHPWMQQSPVSIPSLKELTRSCSDLTPALKEMKKFNSSHHKERTMH